MSQVWRSHASLEASHPVDQEQAEQEETARLKNHIRIHGSTKGYVPRREFPCRGQLVVEDKSGPIWEVVCDACDYSIGVPASTFSDIPEEATF